MASSLFQPDVPQLNSAVTPQQGVAPASASAVSSLGNVIGDIGRGLLSGIAEGDKKQAAKNKGTVLAELTNQLSSVSQAAATGQKSSDWASARTRTLTSQYAANFPELTEDINSLVNSYTASQMGKSITEGSKQEQAQQQVRQQAIQAGYVTKDGTANVDSYLLEQQKEQLFKETQRQYAANAEARAQTASAQATARFKMEQSNDALRRQELLAARDERVNKQTQQKRLSEVTASLVDRAQNLIDGIQGRTDISPDQKILAIQAEQVKLKAEMASQYPLANTETARGIIDQVFKDTTEYATGGIGAKIAQNRLDQYKDEGLLTNLQNNPALHKAWLVSTALPTAVQQFPGILHDTLQAASDIMGQTTTSAAPASSKTIPVPNNLPQVDKPQAPQQPTNYVLAAPVKYTQAHYDISKAMLKDIPKVTDEDLSDTGETRKTLATKIITSNIQSFHLYGDNGYLNDDEINKFVGMLYGDGYNALKSVGKLDLNPELVSKAGEALSRQFEGVSKEIRDEYANASVNIETISGDTEHPVKQVPTAVTKNIVPVVDAQGYLSFQLAKGVSSTPNLEYEVGQLNKKLKPAINNMAKAHAVITGNPDLRAAQADLLPRLFEVKE